MTTNNETHSDSQTRPRRLVICCDGTGQSPRQRKPTNILRLSRAIKPIGADGTTQITYYQWGVGSAGWRDKLTGGAFGDGLEQNVEHAYRFLVHNYEPGDEVLLFGFSRGAFTARSLAGLIAACGILRKEHSDLIDLAYESFHGIGTDVLPPEVKAKYSHDATIEFLGVWDTVGLMGVPRNRIFKSMEYYSTWPFRRKWVKASAAKVTPGFLKRLSSETVEVIEEHRHVFPLDHHAFHDSRISPVVRRAFHALAIDEKRPTYEPNLWHDDVDEGQVVQQRWFAGTHSDIGGVGNGPIAARTMKWVVGEAIERCGLDVDGEFWADIQAESRQPGKVSKSPDGLMGWVLGVGMKEDRRIHQLENRTVAIHETTREMILDPNTDYWPSNLDRERVEHISNTSVE